MKKVLVIFDCFGVIFGEIAPLFFARYFEPKEAARVKERLCYPADIGEITTSQLHDRIAELLGVPKEEVEGAWEELVSLDEKIPPIIEKIRGFADVVLLSNASSGVVEGLFERYDLNRLFDRTFISCNLKMAKPDPKIYQHVKDTMGEGYEEIYMIDDNRSNLSPLDSLGINPVLFTSAESIIQALSKYM